jgi:hypothetical protein
MYRASMLRARRAGWISAAALGAASALALPRDARAFEFFDGRLEMHGFYEAQVRSLVRDYDFSDDWDLTQWWNVLNVEIESNLAPDGVGPFDLVSAFGRVEVRYDCVWTHACTLFDSVNAYGDSSYTANGRIPSGREQPGRVPRRLIDGRRPGYTFQLPNGDTRHWYGVSRDELGGSFGVPVSLGGTPGSQGPRTPLEVFQVTGFDGLFGIGGPNGILGDADDPAPEVFSGLADCRFGSRRIKGQVGGVGTQVLVHAVDEDDCRIDPEGFLAGKANPFRGMVDFYGSANVDSDAEDGDRNPATGTLGSADLPLRPATRVGNDDLASGSTPRGIWYPNQRLQQLLDDDEFDNFDQNYREREELAWNRGASQQDTKELKELYLDLEAFDSRLWLRLGKQQIVWGKTELFRTTDQFNPQDLALGSLTSLEESRIALWSARGIWSFFEVGPLEDVRLELAANIQDFEPADLGRCGEPYTPLPVCNKTFGLMAHGLVGVAVAGEVRPDDLDESASGLEYGGRLEFRAGRFSFAISDFFGFNDTPYTEQIFRYTRNVDPLTGRPRHTMASGPCGRDELGNLTGAVQPDCLIGRDPLTGDPSPAVFGPDPDGNTVLIRPGFGSSAGLDALENHSVNQNYFALICATSIGFNDLDPSACGQSVFNSTNAATTGDPIPLDQVLNDGDFSISELLMNAVAGNPGANDTLSSGLAGAAVPFVSLVQNPCDGFLSDCATPGPLGSDVFSSGGTVPTANFVLTAQQQALFGCGEFYGTNCELHGIDLLNAEASALLQSMFGFEGTPVVDSLSELFADGPLGDSPDIAQPGTMSFAYNITTGVPNLVGPVCTRFEDGTSSMLPGCRGPGPDFVPGTADDDPGYDPNLDGLALLLHPFFDPSNPVFFRGTDSFAEFGIDQTFRSELAAASFNLVMGLVALSSPNEEDGDTRPEITEFDNRLTTGAMGTATNGQDDDRDGAIDEADEGDPNHIGPYRRDGCSFIVPHLCSSVSAFNAITGLQRNSVRAAGNANFGRRDFLWHGGQDLILRYDKRNVLGFSADFAEDVTKTNWGLESTWIKGLPVSNADEIDGLSEVDTYNVTISVDRPTFINFMNANRTFFINSQWFLQYIKGYDNGMPGTGPFNFLGILNTSTGYFQDRLLPTVTFVYDVQSNSGAVLPSIAYRFTENFSATFGAAAFFGRWQARTTALTPTSLGNRAGSTAYNDYVQNGLSVIEERDEFFLRVRYTF